MSNFSSIFLYSLSAREVCLLKNKIKRILVNNKSQLRQTYFSVRSRSRALAEAYHGKNVSRHFPSENFLFKSLFRVCFNIFCRFYFSDTQSETRKGMESFFFYGTFKICKFDKRNFSFRKSGFLRDDEAAAPR